ncbi:hypothetical protein CDL12_26865 [Handroanthus impetiginosus]|uniref:CCHC-type domain-containing protein n=1 Tax=Handroanthus impetiginosus TaxID=429701 RepID=A0A2G9G5P3_9LAMI|nr:hypothetical protein CDL12_26865 [Handroanthus impetiginosus]
MANLAKFEFVPLDISGKNYLSWVVDAKMHLDAMGLENTIVEKNEATIQNRAKAMIFLRHHLDESLKERYDRLKLVVLPKARYDWLHLRLQDFKSISEYNSTMFKITSQLMLSEQNNELLMKNHESRPTGSSPFPEANATNFSNSGRDRDCGRGRSHGRGRGRDRYNYRNYGNGNHDSFYHKGKQSLQKKGDFGEKRLEKFSQDIENLCFRCSSKGHWSHICRNPKHLVELYQASLKKKNKNVETNFTNSINNFDNDNDTNDIDIAHLDVADFFEHLEDNINHLIGNGNVQKN